MALSGSKVYSGPLVTKRTGASTSHGVICSFVRSLHDKLNFNSQEIGLRKLNNVLFLKAKYVFPNEYFWRICENHAYIMGSRGFSVSCMSTGTRGAETKECVRNSGDCSDMSSAKTDKEDDEDQEMTVRIIDSRQGLAEAYKFVHNDAKFMNERARNDIFLLSRGIRRLDARARQDVAILGSGFLKLDARAREDTEIIDRNVKRKAERLHHIATILKDKAHSRLKRAADKHWSDGALEADLRRADFRAKQRAVEDTLMALEFVKDVHDMMVSKLYNCPLGQKIVSQSENDVMENLKIEKNGRTCDLFPGKVSVDRISAIQEAYLSMASALSEADGIDYTDPEELELLVTTLIDLDAMDGKSSVSLLAECSSSPDVNTRQALANALAKAPSMWTLGNAGMGALQRLAEDSDPAVAAAASRAIYELKEQWEIEEGDSWRFTMNQSPEAAADRGEDTDADIM